MKTAKYFGMLLIIMLLSALMLSCSSTAQKGGNESSEKAGTNQSQPAEEKKGTETLPAVDSGNKNNDTSDTKKEALLKDMMDVPMEDITLEDLNGKQVKLSDFKGKIIFLNFWASWCPPCREEMPDMQKIYEKYKDKDVVIVAVNSTGNELRGGTDDKEAEKRVRSFIKENGYTFPVYLDRHDEAWSIYQQRGIPTNYIIDKEGIVRYGFAGAFQSEEQMIQYIDNIHGIE